MVNMVNGRKVWEWKGKEVYVWGWKGVTLLFW